MKKLIYSLALAMLIFPVSAQEESDERISPDSVFEQEHTNISISSTEEGTFSSDVLEEQKKTKKTKKILEPETEFVPFTKFYVDVESGFAYSLLTRLKNMSKYNRSNFVWQNHLIGAYTSIKTHNLPVMNYYVRFGVYYPLIHTFNGMKQNPKQTILYAFEGFAGPYWTFDQLKYVNFMVSPGIHYFYQLTDEYHLHHIGLGLYTGVELPFSRRWTVLINPGFALDNANLGSNQKYLKYDWSWQYKCSIGVRYSKRSKNFYHYFHTKKDRKYNIHPEPAVKKARPEKTKNPETSALVKEKKVKQEKEPKQKNGFLSNLNIFKKK